jgi:hypothetical protein
MWPFVIVKRYQDELIFNAKINDLDIAGQLLTILDRSLA